jgi:hypothetical protein
MVGRGSGRVGGLLLALFCVLPAAMDPCRAQEVAGQTDKPGEPPAEVGGRIVITGETVEVLAQQGRPPASSSLFDRDQNGYARPGSRVDSMLASLSPSRVGSRVRIGVLGTSQPICGLEESIALRVLCLEAGLHQLRDDPGWRSP